MKRIVTFLLVLVSLVGIIGYSPVSAKAKTEDYLDKGKAAIVDFMYNTNDKYEVIVKNASSYKALHLEDRLHKKSWYTDDYYYENGYASTDKTLTVQLQLISTKTGKAVKNSKVKYYAYNDYDEANPDYITRDGKYTFSEDDMVFAVYKKKIYRVWMGIDEEAIKKQEKINSDPFKYAPHAETTDHWYLVPKGYTWEGYSYINHYSDRDRVTGERVEYSDIFNAVFIYSGQKIEWVIKNFDTGEEISVNKSQKKVWKDETLIDAFCGETINAALGVKKNGKTLTYKELGNANYLASNLGIYYNGMIYETMVVMLPTKVDADWCIAHADNLSDTLVGEMLDLYDYCEYKGLSTKPWESLR